jgi:thiamine biosynthesis lipoprotein
MTTLRSTAQGEHRSVGQGTLRWPVRSRVQASGRTTTARVVLTAGDHPELLDDARAIVEEVLGAVDKASGRARPDAEIHRLYRAAGRTVTVSPLLAELVATALAAARRSGGSVDPTVGAAVTRLAHDRDRSVLPVCGSSAGPAADRHRPAPGWQVVRLEGRRLTVPAGVTLDLSATAKAFAADRAARRLAAELGAGALVALGGDVATAGPAPDGGWRLTVQDHAGDAAATVTLPAGAAVATSGVRSRTAGWSPGRTRIVDPATGTEALTPWLTASVVAVSCVQANTLATAALVRGATAPRWLRELGAPARLVGRDGGVVTVGGWHPEPGPVTPVAVPAG